jgi:hypothetical protein
MAVIGPLGDDVASCRRATHDERASLPPAAATASEKARTVGKNSRIGETRLLAFGNHSAERPGSPARRYQAAAAPGLAKDARANWIFGPSTPVLNERGELAARRAGKVTEPSQRMTFGQ